MQVGPDDVKYSRMITYETLNVAVRTLTTGLQCSGYGNQLIF